ncbi:hypothetical protein QP162_10190 [Sphingomonas aurantiaca]|jgi:hypothetical protein|uniref:hypothetical protein n=1 Tax=Sphingomonas aurantiaca TaxID=185949 RepID=UPI00142D7C92
MDDGKNSTLPQRQTGMSALAFPIVVSLEPLAGSIRPILPRGAKSDMKSLIVRLN